MTQTHATETAPHDHPPHLAHHFDTPAQQFESGKLGMWVFLATEILMFGGLFCAYAIYRGNHPLIFLYGHHYLDTTWGAINTVVLLVSSFTMAWGVRAAQLGQKRLLVWMLALTFIGGCGFMAIKAREYQLKFSHDLGPGTANLFFNAEAAGEAKLDDIHHLEAEYDLVAHSAEASKEKTPTTTDHNEPAENAQPDAGDASSTAGTDAPTATATAQTGAGSADNGDDLRPAPPQQTNIPHAGTAPNGLKPKVIARHAEQAQVHESEAGHGVRTFSELPYAAKERVHIFFQTYFLMTGLHGLHVLIGMGLIAWIGIRALKNHFSPQYFAPVEIVGLYWHLVDLIWIFLFPLLYLIH